MEIGPTLPRYMDTIIMIFPIKFKLNKHQELYPLVFFFLIVVDEISPILDKIFVEAMTISKLAIWREKKNLKKKLYGF